MIARIVKGMGGTYFAYLDDELVEVIPTGTIRKSKLIIGDKVEVEKDQYSTKYVATKVLPRANQLVRPKVANVDQLAIVIAPKPAPDYLLVDKLIVCCKQYHIRPLLVINKADLPHTEQLWQSYNGIVPIVKVSSVSKSGFDQLLDEMKGKVTAFAGQSAVGKSTLIGNLFQLQLDTGELSKKLDRGKHTTRHTELFHCGNEIWVMDTPGFSLYSLDGVESAKLQDFYPDFTPYRQCRFANCVHTTDNVQVCGVRHAVEEEKIDKDRYHRYCHLYQEIKNRENIY